MLNLAFNAIKWDTLLSSVQQQRENVQNVVLKAITKKTVG